MISKRFWVPKVTVMYAPLLGYYLAWRGDDFIASGETVHTAYENALEYLARWP